MTAFQLKADDYKIQICLCDPHIVFSFIFVTGLQYYLIFIL